MTHFQDEGHYQEQMNAQAQAEMEALAAEAQAQAEFEALNKTKEAYPEQEQSETGKEEPTEGEWKLYPNVPQPDWDDVLQEASIPTELSFGQKLVGLTFNPSGDAKVQKAKELCAELADLLNNHYQETENGSFLEVILYQQAVGQILNAQMNVVKVLTFKY